MDLTPQQRNAVASAASWYRKRGTQRFSLGGYAGTGKTTCIRHIIDACGLRDSQVAFCTFTGKAATVLTGKGCAATTIHRLIYRVKEVQGPQGRRLAFARIPALSSCVRLIVVDEAPMVSRALMRDLHAFGVPILLVGDPGQLGPVEVPGDEPPVDFVSGYDVLQTPDALLSQIHRQAEGSPIIRMSLDIREGRPLGTYGDAVTFTNREDMKDHLLGVDQVLCGRNETRHRLNALARAMLGFTSTLPSKGEKIICTRNDWGTCSMGEFGIYLTNGLIGTVARLKPRGGLCPSLDFRPDFGREMFVDLALDTRTFDNAMRAAPAGEKKCFFEYGYAVTCHKLQGSEANSVLVLDEPVGRTPDEVKRWRYTAITRASERLVWVR